MNTWREGFYHLRSLIIRLSITYVVLLGISLLPGVRFQEGLFHVWLAAFVFVLLSRFLRPIILALTLPLTITTAGLFIFVIDGALLMLTDLLTGLEIRGFGWAILAGVVMSVVNIWLESAFQRLGWLPQDEASGREEITSPGWMLRLLLLAVLVIGIVFSFSMAFQVALALSTVTANLVLIGAGALVILVLVSLGISWLVAEGMEARHLTRFSAIVAGLTTTIGILLVVGVLRAPVTTPASPPAWDAYWELPTGSRIAYEHYAAVVDEGAAPLVYLHDGPGHGVLEPERAFVRQFAADGFDVYVYDRVGTGRSGRLADVTAYGIERDIADLDAIRGELGAESLILMGQGAGAELAARYLSEYPERVESVILQSPVPLADEAQFRPYQYARTAAPTGPNAVLEPRLLTAAALAGFGPEAAQNLASQEEMGVIVADAFNPGTWVCAGDAGSAPEVDLAGANYYVELRTSQTERVAPDPRSALAENLTPSLVLAAECDYVPWGVVVQYQEALLNETVFYFEDAGHAIQLTQADLLADVIGAFLRDGTYPILPHGGLSDPRPALGP